jgi:hypothetical protein
LLTRDFFTDDFDDFQSAGAPEAPAPVSLPAKPASQSGGVNFFDMMSPSSQSSAPANVQQQQPQLRTSHNMPAGPTYINSGNTAIGRPGMGMQTSSFNASTKPSASSSSVPTMATTNTANKPKAGAFDFDDLFAASGAKKINTTAGASGGNTIASLAQQKQNSSLWGVSSGAKQVGNANHDDLLF